MQKKCTPFPYTPNPQLPQDVPRLGEAAHEWETEPVGHGGDPTALPVNHDEMRR